MSKNVLVAMMISLALVAGCSDDDNPTAAAVGTYTYEGWAIINGAPVSTGKFNLSTSGSYTQSFTNIANLSSATAVVVTIEPPNDTDSVPASTKIVGGAVATGSATLTTAFSDALNNNFTSAAGKFILATPTDGDQTAANEKSGLWFLDPVGPAAGLTLVMLPAGWKYEGWVVINGTPFSTGTFLSPAGADSNASNPPYSPVGSPPPFPGEDFLINAPTGSTFPVDLTTAGSGGGADVVISIEPSPDDSTAPFTLKPLIKQIPTGTTGGSVVTMTNNASSFPTGTATISGTTLTLTLMGFDPLK